MLHVNHYDAYPDGWRKKMSFGPTSGPLAASYQSTAVFDPATLASDPDYGVPYFLWIKGDGDTPRIRPSVALTLPLTGSVSDGPTPYQLPSGAAEVTETYDGASSRGTVGYSLDPPNPLTDDCVWAIKGFASNLLGTAYQVYFSTSSGANGWIIYYNYTNARMAFSSAASTGGIVIVSPMTMTRNSPFTVVVILRRSGGSPRAILWCNNLASGTVSDDGDSIAGSGTGLGRSPAGTPYTLAAGAGITWAAMWTGAGIAANWEASTSRLTRRLMAESCGLRETVSRALWWYQPSVGASDTAGQSKQDRNGNWWLYSPMSPRAGDSTGLLLERDRACLTYRNSYPLATTGWTATGGTFTFVADVAALTAAKAVRWGDNVFSLANTTGSDQYVYGGAAATAAPHSLQVMARYAAGSGARLGWRDASSGVFTDLGPISDNYVRSVVNGSTPPDTDCQYCIKVPTGCTLLFIAQQLELGVVATMPMVNYNTGSGVRSTAGWADTEYSPSDVSGSYLTTVAPSGFTGTAAGADVSVLTRVTTPADILHIESAAPGWARGDGTTQIATGSPTNGVFVDVWSAWKQALQYIQAGPAATRVMGAYDGTMGGSGNLRASAAVAGVVVKKIDIRTV